MAPQDGTSADIDGQRASYPSTNPFVAFKRFADEQFSSLINHAFGSNPFIMNPAISLENFRKEHGAWLQRSREVEGRLRSEDWEGNESEPCPYRGSKKRRLSDEETADLCSFLDLYNSEYSPLQLEKQHPFDHYGGLWREAFGDLVKTNDERSQASTSHASAEHLEESHEWFPALSRLTKQASSRCGREAQREQPGQDLTSNTKQSAECPDFLGRSIQEAGRVVDAAEDELRDCIQALLEWGPFGESQAEHAQPEANSTTSHEEAVDGNEEGQSLRDGEVLVCANDETELDMIRDLLGVDYKSVKRPEHRHTSKTQVESNANTNLDTSKPNVMSTLTTTETTTLPDGTVHTKVVLKKRFADGREESKETVHTQNGVLEVPKASIGESIQKQSPRREQVGSDKNNEKRGWFWN